MRKGMICVCRRILCYLLSKRSNIPSVGTPPRLYLPPTNALFRMTKLAHSFWHQFSSYTFLRDGARSSGFYHLFLNSCGKKSEPPIQLACESAPIIPLRFATAWLIAPLLFAGIVLAPESVWIRAVRTFLRFRLAGFARCDLFEGQARLFGIGGYMVLMKIESSSRPA